MIDFYLGVHRAYWAWKDDPDINACLDDIPLFVSHNQLKTVVNLHPARRYLAVDSGAFSIVSSGGWANGDTPRQYVSALNRYADALGPFMIRFAGPQDSMCEPHMLKITGMTVRQHCELTVQNYLELKSLDCRVRIIPSVQGWELRDYEYSLWLYDKYGVDLHSERYVGLGSVCRRQHTDEIAMLVRAMRSHGLNNIHTFGVKTLGIEKYADDINTGDSMSWSYQAFKNPAPHDHPHKLGNCANCYIYAANWWRRLRPMWDRKVTA